MASILNDEIHQGKEVVRKKFSFGDQQLILRSTIPDKAAVNLIQLMFQSNRATNIYATNCGMRCNFSHSISWILKYYTVIRGTYILRSILGIEACLKTLVLLNFWANSEQRSVEFPHIFSILWSVVDEDLKLCKWKFSSFFLFNF